MCGAVVVRERPFFFLEPRAKENIRYVSVAKCRNDGDGGGEREGKTSEARVYIHLAGRAAMIMMGAI